MTFTCLKCGEDIHIRGQRIEGGYYSYVVNPDLEHECPEPDMATDHFSNQALLDALLVEESDCYVQV